MSPEPATDRLPGFQSTRLGLHSVFESAEKLPQVVQMNVMSTSLLSQIFSSEAPQNLWFRTSLVGLQSLLESSPDAPQFRHEYTIGGPPLAGNARQSRYPPP
jgi:hypothetical protein